MKKKLFLLLLLCVLFAGFIVVKFFVLDKTTASGIVRVVSSPNAGVFIDNVAVGKTPYEAKHKPGEYVLKLIPEKEASATASWQGKVSVYKNTLTYISRELGSSDITSAGEVLTITKMETKPKNSNYGEIYVETEPSGGIVYLDNDEKGVSPVILADVMKGDHELSVYIPGFFRRTQKINVDSEYRVNASFKLAIDQTQKTLDKTLDEKRKEASASAEDDKGTKVKISDTPTGFLRVRSEPSVEASEAAQVKPGDIYDLLEEKEGWFKIKLATLEGWISAQYAKKQE
jgi:hypothetical protein